jgi:hypothetical protein
MTYSETRQETERILNKIHDFCRGETMVGKGCVNCPVNAYRVCDEGKGGKLLSINTLKQAEKAIDEVMANE